MPRQTAPRRQPGALWLAALMCASAAGCSNPSAPTAPPPTASTATPPVPQPQFSDRTGVQALLSCSGYFCSFHEVGQTFSGVRWRVAVSGSTVDLYNLDADMAYRGTMDGLRFVAGYPIVPWEFPDHAIVEGEFAQDGSSFEAIEKSFGRDGAREDWRWRVTRR
jgi:hypothetical protein